MQTLEANVQSDGPVFWLDTQTILLTGIALTSIYVLWFWRKLDDDGFKSHVTDGPLTHFRDLPSPRGFPVLGNAAQLGAEPYRKLAKWAETLGPLFRIRLGQSDVLVVNELDLIRKATAKQSPDFGGRPDWETTKLLAVYQSVTFTSYSEEWMKNKKCVVEALKLYTTGRDPTKRSVMEESVLKHANNMVDQLLKQASKEEDNAVDPKLHCFKMGVKAIGEVCFGDALDLDEPTFDMFVDLINNFDRAFGKSQLVNSWPFLKHVPWFGRNFAALKEANTEYTNFVFGQLEDHWQTYNPDKLRDLVDCLKHQSELLTYTSKQENQKAEGAADNDQDAKEIDESGEKASRPSQGATANGESRDKTTNKQQEENTNSAAVDIFAAGFDTVHVTIIWAFFYLAAYPETQTRIRDELNRAVAPDEDPTLSKHGRQCPYTMAWIYEVLRHVAIVPLFVPHQTTKATVLANCFVPKGVMVMFNFWQTTRDPKLWENPEEFRPQRFLYTDPETGGYKLRGEATNRVIAWGLGLRQCPGAQLSRHQIFIMLATIVKRCLIAQSRPGFEPAHPWRTELGLSRKAVQFRVSITPL